MRRVPRRQGLVGGHELRKFGREEGLLDGDRLGKPDVGRFSITKTSKDMYVFRVPSLRNCRPHGAVLPRRLG
jgi:cytochrome c peroxidase